MPPLSRLRRMLFPLTCLVLVATVAGGGALLAAARPEPAPAVEATSLLGGLLSSRRSAPMPVPPAPALAPLPVPVTPPDDPYAPEPQVVIGSIEIPRLGLALPLNEGVTLNSIDRGPSHWPGTALPGNPGNVVVAGHRVTHGGPFRNIDQLEVGDPVIFTVDGRRTTYRVTGEEVVTPDAMRIVDQTQESTATLFACHPPGSAEYRYVVKLALDPAATT